MTKPVYLAVVVPNIRVLWVSVKLLANVELPPSTPTLCTDIVPHPHPKIKRELGVYDIISHKMDLDFLLCATIPFASCSTLWVPSMQTCIRYIHRAHSLDNMEYKTVCLYQILRTLLTVAYHSSRSPQHPDYGQRIHTAQCQVLSSYASKSINSINLL